MKLKYKIWILPALILAIFIALPACDKKEGDGLAPIDEDAQPVIERLRIVEKDSTIVSGTFGEAIAIVGSGLEAVNKVLFNGVETALNINFVTGNTIICDVPATIPTEITNKLEVITGKGKRAETSFTLELPKPVVTTMYNEYAAPGSTTSIIGQYFYFVDKVTFEKSGQAEIIAYTDTEIVIVVPENAEPGERVTVTNITGDAKSNFLYHDYSMGLMDFDIPATSWGNAICWGNLPIVDDATQAVSGKYGSIKGEKLPILGGYNDKYLASTCNFAYGFSGNLDDYFVKFEMNVQESWAIGTLQIMVFAWAYDGQPGPPIFQYDFKPWSERGVVTQGWQTMVVNLSDFYQPAKDKDNKDIKIPININVSDIQNFRIMFVNDEEIPKYDISVDNFRLAKKTLE